MRDGPLLITGANGGVGASLCQHFRGTVPVIAAVRNIEKLETALGSLDGITPIQVDLANPTSIETMLDRLRHDDASVPYVINNAGTMFHSLVEDLSLDDLQRSLQVNALAVHQILAALLPGMKEINYGRVINVTSGAPLNCFPGFAAYSASKAALNALTVTAARECAEYDIKINLMSPGPVRSGMAPDAPMEPSVCHPTVDYLLSLPPDGPTGSFFWLGYELPLFPNLEGVQWLEGRASENMPRVIP